MVDVSEIDGSRWIDVVSSQPARFPRNPSVVRYLVGNDWGTILRALEARRNIAIYGLLDNFESPSDKNRGF